MKKFILIIIGSLFLFSCEKVLLEKDPANDPVTNFELLWETVDQKYAYFNLKDIDWDSVYTANRPKVHDGMSTYELYKVLSDMLYILRDGHVNLITPFDFTRNWTWYLNSPQNFNYSVIERNYLGNNYLITGPLINTVIDSVGYIYYGSFSSGVSSSQIKFVLNNFKGLKGVIFDVRDNGGGNTMNADILASHFAKEKVLTHYEMFKTGPGHNDFSEPIPQYLEPVEDFTFDKPVVVLTNRSSYSATNDFVNKMSVLPNVTIIGDSTGGGGGYPYYAELPNGWRYRFSSTRTLNADKEHIENGITPDIKVDISRVDEANGIDSIIERALQELKK